MPATPARIESELYAAAMSAGEVMSRSAAQQINHWARIGRELEEGRGVSASAISDVLAGRGGYDDLNALEQSVVRTEWAERIAATAADLDLAAEFTAAGDTWVEADSDGRAVTRTPGRSGRRRGAA